MLHLHEPMTPAICVATLARREVRDRRHLARGRRARLDALGLPLWGFLLDRIDHRIAVSEQARISAQRWLPGGTSR